ncbi:MAG TPA: arsinothricin resistance N-acetyltransferase ArsN1 family B [Anaeromyxobacteraceae bacterium]|nr:arsinothricin resistance N-acetyltransferase ArsN1 family B [Anaeromyxobacteraceae bacterium]
MDRIRLAVPSDGAELAAIYRPVVASTAISFETEPPDGREMVRRVEAALAFAPWLVACSGPEVLGYAYAARHRDRAAYRWCVDVSVYVGEGQRRGGVGRALYTSLLALLRLQGFFAAHAGITLPNAPSVGLHEALGFRPIGVYPAVGWKLGAWRDVGWWQLELRERRGPPAPTLSVEDLRRSPAFEGALLAGLAARGASPAGQVAAPRGAR